MKQKLSEIYDFLEKNRIYNHDLQEKSYKSTIACHNSKKDKVIALLYHAANTKPKLVEFDEEEFSKFFSKHMAEELFAEKRRSIDLSKIQKDLNAVVNKATNVLDYIDEVRTMPKKLS